MSASATPTTSIGSYAMGVRRKVAALLNGVLISAFGAKLVPSRSKSFSIWRLSSTRRQTVMAVSKDGRRADVYVRNGTPDWMTFDQIFVDEDYDLRALARCDEIRGIYETIVAAGETPLIVDLGANVGYSAVYFHLCWPKAKIVAVEPDSANFQQLKKNTATFAEIDAVKGAISSHLRSVQIEDPSAEANAMRVVECGTGRGPEVPAMTIPQIFACYSESARPFIVKTDIEGAEADLFSNNVDWIDEVPLLIVELHDWLFPRQRTSRNFLAAVSERDRDFVYLDENIFSIRNCQPGG